MSTASQNVGRHRYLRELEEFHGTELPSCGVETQHEGIKYVPHPDNMNNTEHSPEGEIEDGELDA